MKQKRLTRAQRRELTRERLLKAARTIFVKKGIAATTVEDISEAAGYTRGAFYFSFNGEQDLLIELLRRDDDMASSDLRATMEERSTPEAMKKRAIAYWSHMSSNTIAFHFGLRLSYSLGENP
jgi:AcrR family transcriptional regulator